MGAPQTLLLIQQRDEYGVLLALRTEYTPHWLLGVEGMEWETR